MTERAILFPFISNRIEEAISVVSKREKFSLSTESKAKKSEGVERKATLVEVDGSRDERPSLMALHKTSMVCCEYQYWLSSLDSAFDPRKVLLFASLAGDMLISLLVRD